VRDLSETVPLDDIPETFSWSLGRTVPIAD
jgi:hypothetical protein